MEELEYLQATCTIVPVSTFQGTFNVKAIETDHLPANIHVGEVSTMPATVIIAASNEMETKHVLAYPVEEYLPANVTIGLSSYLPATLNIAITNEMETKVDIEPPPRLVFKNTPVKDAFIRKYVPYLNYGVEGQLVVGTRGGDELQTLLAFDIDNVCNVPNNLEIIDISLKLFIPTKVNSKRIRLWKIASDTWTETGVNWISRPQASDLLGEIDVSNVDGYVKIPFKPVFDLWKAGERFAILIADAEPNSAQNIIFASKESLTPPTIEITAYDPVIYNAGKMHMPAQITVHVIASDYLPANFELKSHNIVEHLPASMQIKQYEDTDGLGATTIIAINEVEHLAAQAGITQNSVSFNYNVDSVEHLPAQINCQRQEQECLAATVGVSRNTVGIIIQLLPVEHLPVTVAVQQPVTTHMPARIGVVHSSVGMNFNILPVEHLPATATILKSANDHLRATAGVTKPSARIAFNMSNVEHMPATINVMHPAKEYLRARTVIRKADNAHLGATVTIGATNHMPARIEIYSENMKAQVVVARRETEHLSATVVPRIKASSDMPARIIVGNNNSYVFIM